MKLMVKAGKILKFSLLFAVLFVQLVSIPPVFANGDDGRGGITNTNTDDPEKKGGTVLPGTDFTLEECKGLMNTIAGLNDQDRRDLFAGEAVFVESGGQGFALGASASDVLACGIRTGQIRLWMVPYYIRYILEFVIGIGGLIAVGGIVYGGYLYLFAGISEDKDKGKKAIIYGVAGMVMTLVAWAVVNIVISVVTA